MNNVVPLEKWKDIKGYEDEYLISNFGRVMSLRRKRKNGKGYYYTETKMLKPSKTTTGYWKVELYKNKKKRSFKVHRLVAHHFVANPYKKEQVNHIDGNPLNNQSINLEWVNAGENIIHAVEEGLKEVFNIDRKSLEHLYIEKNLSLRDIGQLFNISTGPIQRLLEEHGITKEIPTTYQIEEDWLKEQINKGKRNKDIATIVGCDVSLISKYRTRIEKGERIYGTK